MNAPIPPSPPSSPPQPSPPPAGGVRLRRFARGVGVALLVAWFAFGGLVLALRGIVLPRVGDYREQVASVLAREIGLPVSIEGLEADWSGLRPRLHLAGLIVRDAEGRAALRLEKVDATVGWSSLLRLQPFFRRIELFSPTLDIRREVDGALVVAGMRLAAGPADGRFADWLLSQGQIVVRDATLSWTDAVRAAPTLHLTEVEFRLDRSLGIHRFGLRAQAPVALASALEVRGELRRLSAARPAAASGRLYVALERADLGGWRPWVDYPVALAGSGGLRLWLDFEAGHTLSAVADLALADVVAQLDDALPALQLDRLDGRLVASRAPRAFAIEAKQLALRSGDGVQLAPTDFVLRVRHGDGGELRANLLDLGALSRLAGRLPLGEAVRARLAAFDARGTVRDLRLEWKGEAEAPAAWTLAARFDDIGLAARDALPGVGGLSGDVQGNERGGRFVLAGRDMHIDLPAVFDASRLAFSSLRADGGWVRRDGRLEIALDSASFENPDAAGTAAGRYWPEPGGAGEIDLSARLSRAEGTAVWRYLPRVVNRDTHEWVRNAIRYARVPETRLRLKGRLDDFPFRDGNGQFLVAIKVADGRLDYAPGWPGIEGIDGEVRFEGPGMRIEARRGRIFGVELANVVADVPDLDVLPSETMTLTGRATGSTADFLRFISESPVAARIEHFTDGMRAEGSGTLDLRFVMPLRNVAATTVRGEYRFAANRLWLIDGLPPLTEASGRVRFTGDELSIPQARAQLFGEALNLSAATGDDGTVRFKADGAVSGAGLRTALGAPLFDHLAGRTDWQAEVALARDGTRVSVHSGLDGLASSLPYPLNKPGGERWPLAVELTFPKGTGQSALRARLAERIDVATEQRGTTVIRGGIGVFQPARVVDGGVMVAAELDELDVDAWRRALGQAEEVGESGDTATDAGVPLPLAGVALQAKQVQVFGQRLSAVKLRAVADPGGWKARLDSTEAGGEFDWRKAGDGTLQAHFRHLAIGSEEEGAEDDEAARTTDAAAGVAQPSPRRLPGLDVKVDRLALRGRELGRLEVLALNRRGEWALERFALSRAEARLEGKGRWRTAGSPRTELDFALDTPDIGRFTQALGYPDAVRGGRARLSGQLAWAGAPTRIDYPSLGGRLELDAESGQFNKLEPGVGRLLGVLSLQALPRRITLDFRDVFSDGFAFDRISGSIDVAAGVMHTDNLEIRGPAARVRMRGDADVAAETQDLRVTVQPTLSESVAIGAAAGLINPVAGVVTYLAQKALSDPIEKLFAYDYAITGSWSDPQVAKLGSPAENLIPSLPGLPSPAPAKPRGP